jgi:hypothetical protein
MPASLRSADGGRGNEGRVWKVNCQENLYPGMWQRWFKNQCAAVGWAAKWGYTLDGSSRLDHGWSTARNAISRMQVGIGW